MTIRNVILVLLTMSVSMNPFGTYTYAQDVDANVAAPKEMIDAVLYDFPGHERTLSKIKGDAPLVLMFWAMWSPQCKRALKELKLFEKQWEKKGLKVVTINVDRDQRTLSRFISREDVPSVVLKDPLGFYEKAYDIFLLPTNILIDKNGRIVYRGNTLPDRAILAEYI